MHSQDDCDEMKAICEQYGLKIGNDFSYEKDDVFEFDETCFGIFYGWTKRYNDTQVIKSEFIELLKKYER
jgi:hypothetical protein